MTAAHCMKKNEYPKIARAGEMNIAETNDSATPEDIPIRSIIVHENYHASKQINDIALVYLSRPVTYKRRLFTIFG